jgi:hypothetical protein
MKPAHRARLLELAAAVVSEAFDLYLDTQTGRANAVRSALALKGSMGESEAADLMNADPEHPG